MTDQLKAIKDAFDTAKITYAYNVFPTDESSPAFPYVTGFVTSGQGLSADNENYFDTMNLNIVLFTKVKDPTTEDKVRGVLKSLRCVYEWDESYATDEKMYIITYSITMEC